MITILAGIIVFALALLAPQIVQAQGTMTYLSNIGQPSAGSYAVGSDTMPAALFKTGTNASGYLLDSIQLGMTDASGSPSGFTAMIYTIYNGSPRPDYSIGTLDGSLDPVTAGIYTFTAISNILLLPTTHYFIVLTAGTAVADGAYDWSYADATSYNPSDGWVGVGSPGNNPQYAINAIPVPEPGVLGLSVLGGLALLWHRRKSKAVQ